MKEKRLEALHLVALEIDALQKERRKDKGAAKARRLSDEAVRLWKEQFRNRRNCPHCGQPLD